MSSKIILILAFVCNVVITTTSGASVKTCNDQCNENFLTRSVESRFYEYRERIESRFCDEESNVNVDLIDRVLDETMDEMLCKYVTDIVPLSNGGLFFPILALMNQLFNAMTLLTNLPAAGANSGSNAAGFNGLAFHEWYVNSHSSMATFHVTLPEEIRDCMADYVDTAKMIIDNINEAFKEDTC